MDDTERMDHAVAALEGIARSLESIGWTLDGPNNKWRTRDGDGNWFTSSEKMTEAAAEQCEHTPPLDVQARGRRGAWRCTKCRVSIGLNYWVGAGWAVDTRTGFWILVPAYASEPVGGV